MKAPPKLLTTQEAIQALAIDRLHAEGRLKHPERLIRAMVQRGELEGRQVGHRLMVTERSVNRLLEGR